MTEKGVEILSADNVTPPKHTMLRTSGIMCSPATTSAPNRLSLPSFLNSDSGTCMGEVWGDSGRERKMSIYKP